MGVNKHLLGKATVLALGLTCAIEACAQSSVTLYGIVDGGLLYLNKTVNASGGKGGKLFAFTDSGQLPSQFGLRGVEDLGGGLSAEFRLESGINIGSGGYNNSNGNFLGRRAYVGLTGAFGEIKAGLQFSPFFDALFALDPVGMSNFGSSLLIYANNIGATGAFNSNALSYTTPLIAGLRGSAMLALGGEAGNFSAGRQYSAGLSYQWGGLRLNAAYYNGNPGGTIQTIPPTTVGFEGRMIGASYTFGRLTAKASFTNYKVTGTGTNNNVYGGGIDYALTPAVDLNGGVWYVSNRNDTSSHALMASLGAGYFLSKATALYAQVGVVNNHGGSNLGLALGDAPTSSYAPAGTTVGAVAGIRHFF
ncbi:porin [Burkholderia ubonensis]|uniref:porin n=1 Tax=Burkholderia ubonensis TaxID=101571 RepID=UPI000BA7B664|nr:porin [Burkholderia ubonensis]PAJ85329.1 porin [Burkholderia ubonensis]PAJ92275.1 porin [Burkholderia ubonensis]PAK05631.1 porin [Burkholderia ubonensis]RQP67688.1 porin [Burkholderia ubonensis]RQP84775.1 porin [Burkholderia ubonensis]